ncbi:MAG: restriction endonuclease subunit S [Paludibacteraceae bacterium]|nr:restriction endonuclease subunit S [Paludibacteraceae bacterium]
MTYIEQMIKDMCPHGVEWKTLGEVCEMKRGSTITANQAEEGEIPVIAGGQKPAYFHNQSNRTGKNITVAGSGAYAGYVAYWEQPIFVSDAFTVTPKESSLDIKFVYYFLTNIQDKIYHTKKGSGVPHVHPSSIADFEIPLPPLEIQEKIVEILDKFSTLAAELQAELQMRRKQYEYYRTQLLTPHSDCNSATKPDDCNWEWKTFAELGVFYGGLSGKSKEDFKDGNAKFITYLNIGCNPALRLDISETVKIGPNERQNIVQYGDALFTGSSETPDECAMSSVVTEQPAENLYLNSFCFGFRFNSLDGICPAFYKHYFRSDAFRKAVRRTANGTTRFNVSKKEFAKLSIPIPPLAEQERIVSILDKFEALTTSLSDGIPAEQAAQQKRYEYYRDLLLTFPCKAV